MTGELIVLLGCIHTEDVISRVIICEIRWGFDLKARRRFGHLPTVVWLGETKNASFRFFLHPVIVIFLFICSIGLNSVGRTGILYFWPIRLTSLACSEDEGVFARRFRCCCQEIFSLVVFR